MENDTPNVDAQSNENLSTENAHENAHENAQENSTEKTATSQAPDDAEKMTVESMTAEVSKIYAGFDPTKHAVNSDGSPRMKADGSYANKRGRKPGQTAAVPSPGAQTGAAKPVTAPLSAKKARESGLVTNKAAAHATVKTVVYALGSTIGPEWDFETPEEAQNMLNAVEAYYDANGQLNISPEMMLSFQVLAYAAPRTQHPNTKEKLKNAWAWCKGLFAKVGG
jgi:hypothetical protein